MCEDKEREEKQSEFWRAQEQLHRRLELSQMLFGSDRTAAERRAWDSYNQQIRGY